MGCTVPKRDLLKNRPRFEGSLWAGYSPHEQRHTDVLFGRKLRQKKMLLPYVADLAVAESRQTRLGKLNYIRTLVVYRPKRRSVEAAYEVKKSTFTCPTLADNGDALPTRNL